MSPKPAGNLYHLILGLPEEVSAPNHYELLGLDHRTGDSALIKSAAADQNRKLLHWQNSDRYAEVKALLFELVEARDVLLNEESRAAYDARLGDWGLLDQGPWIVEEPKPNASSPGPLSVRCPECEARFKLRNRDLIGERIPCPECGFRFEVRPEEDAGVEIMEQAVVLMDAIDSDAELKALENFDDMEDLPHSPGATLTKGGRRRNAGRDGFEPNSPRPRPVSRRSRSRRSRTAMIAGGVLMAIGFLTLLGIWISGPLSSSAPSLKHELAYLPGDIHTIGYYRLGDVARSPVFQDQLTRMAQVRALVDQFRDKTGMELEDIERIVIGTKEDDPLRFQSQLAANPLAPRFVAVVRSAKEWDRTRLIGTHSESATHNNLTYHTFQPEPASPERWAFYLPDAKTLIFGSENAVQAAMGTEGRVANWPDTGILQPDYPIVNANIAGFSSFRPITLPGIILPEGMNASTQGTALKLSGHDVSHITFFRFSSEGNAAEFVRFSENAEGTRSRFQPSSSARLPGGTGMTFTQHGHSVAVAQDNAGGINAEHMLVQAVSPAVALLARLGEPRAMTVNPQNSSPQ